MMGTSSNAEAQQCRDVTRLVRRNMVVACKPANEALISHFKPTEVSCEVQNLKHVSHFGVGHLKYKRY